MDSQEIHYQYQPFVQKYYQSSDAEIVEHLPRLIIWNYQGFYDAPLSTGFLELILKYFRCKDAPFGARYWAKIKSNLNRNKVNLKGLPSSSGLSGNTLTCAHWDLINLAKGQINCGI
jgi:hypothetical protein